MNLGVQIAKGNTAAIYLYDNKIIKVFDDRFSDGEAVYEARKQQFAYSSGLPVPQIFDVIHIDGKQAIVMEYINGSTVGDLIQRDMAKAETYLALTVDMQKQLHTIDADSLEPMKMKLSHQIQSAPNFDEATSLKLLRYLDSLPFDTKLCHGDFHAFNLIQAIDRVVILDWVDSSAGNVYADVYRSYLLYLLVSPALAEIYLRLYCDKADIRRKDIFAWAPVVAAAKLSEGVSSGNEEILLQIIHQFFLLDFSFYP